MTQSFENDINDNFEAAKSEIENIKTTYTPLETINAINTALNGKQATIEDLETIRSNALAGKSASDACANHGDIVTHDADEFLSIDTKYGSSVVFSIDPSTFVITAQLKDQDGNNLGTAQTIDLPLESMVVRGSYNKSAKKVVLTLQNGNTTEFPIGDIIAGLQSEITSTNKLDADLVDDSSATNKFVTTAEKNTWNSKANGSHNHTKSQITDFSHTHTKSEITDFPTIPAATTESTVSGWGFTKNEGTITGITMNGSSKGTSGVVDLGTVITEHQDISGKVDKTSIASSVNASSTNAQIVGAKLFYDTVGDIESVLDTIIAGN